MKKAVFVFMAFIVSFSAYAQIVDMKEGEDYKWGFVDKKGKWVIKPIYYYTHWFPKSKYGTFNETSHDKTGMVNMYGKTVIPCVHREIYASYEEDYKHYIVIIKDTEGLEKIGLIDVNGNEILPFIYKHLSKDGYGNYLGEDYDGYLGYYDKKGNAIITLGKYSWFRRKGDYIVVGNINSSQKEPKWMGILDEYGKEIVSVDNGYSQGEVAGDNIFLVKKNGKYGYFANDTEIIPCQYDEASVFTDDVAMVKKDGQVKLIKNPLKEGEDIRIAENTVKQGNKKQGNKAQSRYPAPNSDVDKNIPSGKTTNENTFAFIIANENYTDAPVPYALNDGRVFREYCVKTLGLPEKNINIYEDATYGTIIAAVEKMKDIAVAYESEASVIFYYAGHGFPDEKQNTAYLLPVDGNANNITVTGYSLAKLYKEMSEMKLKSTVVFLDACFSGAKREDEMLTSARGVAIKVREEAPRGNMVVFSAAQGDETAHQMMEKRHGLFTYYLLKGLQQSDRSISLGELADYVIKQVKRQSVVINSKKQTPTVIPSATVVNTWREMKLN